MTSTIERREYEVSVSELGLQAPNRAHGIRTYFRDQGLEIVPRAAASPGAAAWRFELRTTGFGRIGAVTPPARATRTYQGRRVEYARPGGLTEWYENRQEGLEQGFRIASRVPGKGRLVIAMTHPRAFRTAPTADASGFDILDATGAPVLRYAKLAVEDAAGERVPAELAAGAGELRIEIDDAGAVYPLDVDPLVNTPSWIYSGVQHWSELGFAVSTAGDVNGDGYSDVIVGVPFLDSGSNDEGRVYVFHGSAQGVKPNFAWFADANVPDAHLGFSVAGGNVNGSTNPNTNRPTDDVIVGAPRWSNGQSEEGAVFVWHGGANTTSGLPGGTFGSPLNASWKAEVDQIGAHLGHAVAFAGYVNGNATFPDFYGDVIAGAPEWDAGSVDEGAAFLWAGSPAGLANGANGTLTNKIWMATVTTASGGNSHAGARFGHAVSCAGTMNPDAFYDVIVSAPLMTTSQGADAGLAYVFFGGPLLSGAPAVCQAPGAGTYAFGSAVGMAGNVVYSGQGRPVVAVGAQYYSNGQADEGAVHVFSATGPGVATWRQTYERNVAGENVGASLGWAGSTACGNNGGTLIIGAPAFGVAAMTGAAYLLESYGSGLVEAWSTTGNLAGSWFGNAVASAGDVNGDGLSDIIVGARHRNNGQGQATVYHGHCDCSWTSAAWTGEPNQTGAQFGFAVAALNVNGDFYDDLVVGAPFWDGGQTDEGAVFLYMGSPNGLGATHVGMTESNIANANFGRAVGSARDVRWPITGGDDLIVGAPGSASASRVFVYTTQSLTVAPYLDLGTPAWSASAPAGSRLGWSVTSGDIDNNGRGDIAVGAPNGGVGGEVYVWISTGTAAVFGAPQILAPAPSGSQFGWSVAMGKLDAFPPQYFASHDLVVGAPFWESTSSETDEGGVFTFLAYKGNASGVPYPATPSQIVDVNDIGAAFGYALAVGDVTGDGKADLVAGAPYSQGQEGRAFFFPVPNNNGLYSQTPTVTFDENVPGARFGSAVILSSGYTCFGGWARDLIVGAPGYSNVQTSEGAVYLYPALGFSPWIDANAAWSMESNVNTAQFGASLASGDVEGDGISDLVVGAPVLSNGHATEGKVFVYDPPSFTNTPLQLEIGTETPIALLGSSDHPNAFRLLLNARSPHGRSQVRLEWQAAVDTIPLDSVAVSVGPWVDTGEPQDSTGCFVMLNQIVDGLPPGTPIHWRARVATDSPWFPYSPWVTLSGSVASECQLVTAGGGLAAVNPREGGRGIVLEAPRPNPFAETTTLRFTLPRADRVSLGIYDMAGRRVRELVSGVLEAGRHTTTWDARDGHGRSLPPGVYLARLQMDREVRSTKLVLTR